jgi:hypothetical protein
MRTTAARLAETAGCPAPDARRVSTSANHSPGVVIGTDAGPAAADGAAGAAGAGGDGVPAARESVEPERWDPVQVPLPTYVTKAKAVRTVRTVDLGEPGTWTSGRLPEAELLSRPEESTTMLLDETEQPRPAVDEPPSDATGPGHRRAVGD